MQVDTPSKTEHKYLAHTLEFLALKWAITEQFHKYLNANNFVMCTDNNPLAYILTSAKLHATGHWWVGSLAHYNFTLNLSIKKGIMWIQMLSPASQRGSMINI